MTREFPLSNKIAISSYSFHGFPKGENGGGVVDIKRLVDHCVSYEVDGIELLIQHLQSGGITTPEVQREFAQYAAVQGIRLVTIAASHNPVQVTAERRAEELTKLKDGIDTAYVLGAPFVRALGGMWGTSKSFQDLLDNDGEDRPLDGYTMDDAYGWAIEALTEGAAYAGERGVTLVLENHWGVTGTAAGCQRIHDAVGSPWLKYVLDTGNFVHRPDQYAEMAVFAQDLAVLHAKVYKGGGQVVTPDLDYNRIVALLREVDFNGYVSIEFEGKAPADEGIRDGLATIRAALAASPPS